MKNKKEYLATYTDWNGGHVTVWEFDTEENPFTSYPLPLYLDCFSHAPAGFEWGAQGAGAEQLAFAILYHHLNDREAALDLYQEFETEVIARLEAGQGWMLTEEQIESFIKAVYIRRIRGSRLCFSRQGMPSDALA